MKTKLSTLIAVIAATACLNAPCAVAQQEDAPSPSPSSPASAQGAGGGRQGGNMQDFMQRINERVKTTLKASDEEWTVIQPLLEKVQILGREAMSGRFGGMRRRGGGQGGTGDQNGGQGAQGGQGERGGQGGGGSPESQALRTALESESTSPEEINTKLAALRESRKKSQAQLDQARDELKKVLTLRQEAALVQMGLLE